MIIYIKNKHSLKIDDFYFKCSIGKNGLSKNKERVIKKHQSVVFVLKNYITDQIELKTSNQIKMC